MRVEKPAPRVTQFTRFGSFSCHLFEGDDGLILIDTGLAGSARSILCASRMLGAPIRTILITHGHNDHCGSLDALTRALPNIDVVASLRTAKLLAGDRTLQPDDRGRPLRGGFTTCRTKPNVIIRPNEVVAGFRAIFTPGHTPDHVSYFHEGTGYLFTGDALHTSGGRLAVSGEFRWRFPFPYFATWDRGSALESARLLRELRPSALFPAHSRALFAPSTALNEAIAYATKAFDRRLSSSGARASA